MVPAQSKLARPLAMQPERMGQWKRKVSSRITDENFVGAKTNMVTKQLKLSANATGVASVAVKQRQASVEDGDDDDEIMSVNNPPKNPNVLLEAADRSDDNDDMDPAPELEDTDHMVKMTTMTMMNQR